VRRIGINVHDPKQDIIVAKRNKKNISVVDNVFTKRKTERQKSDVDINSDSWEVICQVRSSSKCEPIGMVRNTYQRNTFTVFWTGNGPNGCPRWFLNEDNVKVIVDFKDQIWDYSFEHFVKRFSSLSKSYFNGVHSWTSWFPPGFPEFGIFLGVPFFVELVSPEWTFIWISLMVIFAIETFECMRARFTLLSL